MTSSEELCLFMLRSSLSLIKRCIVLFVTY